MGAVVWGGMLAALVLGLGLRGYLVLTADFPLNDGGLFYQMAGELRAAAYRLPYETTYNGAAIPFAYPPLAFYVAAASSDVLGVPLLDMFRYLPLAANVAAVGAFWLLACRLLGDRRAALLATGLFAAMPDTFRWLIMGGGVTRSLGYLFAILAVSELVALFRQPGRRHLAATALLGALAILSHLQWGYFVVYSGALLWLRFGFNREGVRNAAVVAGLTLVMTCPWWALLLLRHGPEVLLAPFSDNVAGFGGPWFGAALLIGLLLLRVMLTRLMAPAAAPAGQAVAARITRCLAWQPVFLLLWILLVVLFDQRSTFQSVAIPVAPLFGYLAAGALGRVRAALAASASAATTVSWLVRLVRAGSVILSVSLILGSQWGLVVAAVDIAPLLDSPLAPGEREALAWIRDQTPGDARILVITDVLWEADRVGEWLPVLTERVSVATPQGSEWLPRGTFMRLVDEYQAARDCADEDAACLDRWVATSGRPFTHVYVAKGREARNVLVRRCCSALRQSLAARPDYRAVFDNEAGTIYERITSWAAAEAGARDPVGPGVIRPDRHRAAVRGASAERGAR